MFHFGYMLGNTKVLFSLTTTSMVKPDAMKGRNDFHKSVIAIIIKIVMDICSTDVSIEI